MDECETDYICGEGQCSNTPGSYECNCTEGKCGLYCALQDPCVTMPCVHGTCIRNCKNEPNYTCDCEEGFYGNSCNETMVSTSTKLYCIQSNPYDLHKVINKCYFAGCPECKQ